MFINWVKFYACKHKALVGGGHSNLWYCSIDLLSLNGITVIVFEKLRCYGIGVRTVHSINDFGDGATAISKI